MKVAYLAQGKLFLLEGGRDGRPIESPFGRQLLDNLVEIQQKKEWKAGGEGPMNVQRSMLWGVGGDFDPRAIPIQITAVTRGETEDDLLYVLSTHTVGALLRYDCAKEQEERLFHKERFLAAHLDRHAASGRLACNVRYPNGTCNLAVISAAGNDILEVTEGDSLDEAPAWIPGAGLRLVFQTAGLARNKEGYAVGSGPYAVARLDLDNGDLVTLLEDPNFDFLLPRMDADGNLYCIRRPYEKQVGPKVTFGQALLDTVLFPFRLLGAIFHFLNFFSMLFAQKPLTTAGGPKTETPDIKRLILYGRVVDAEKAMKTAAADPQHPALVPKTWELLKRTPDGSEQILAQGVVAYDLAANGDVIYTNGSGIYTLRDGKSEMVGQGALVETVAVVD